MKNVDIVVKAYTPPIESKEARPPSKETKSEMCIRWLPA